ncbi:MAG: tRNA epoxyqueuosine(34) reductase QueG [Firmicutes bacterium HGW-Firmicutes-7]|nr:MAG: tRNA epoxyqueuosine(34) reductase QueG [Firmicutes bacterium HGW-Firmicutes-7]
MNIKQEIILHAKEIGIDKIGFCRGDGELQQKELKDAKSFIVILESYNLYSDNNWTSKLYGKMSKAAIFEDYHKIVRRKLERLQHFITDRFKCNSNIYCDQSPFFDRSIALRAGLGAIGKNTFLINKEHGTSTFIGYVLTDLKLDHYNTEIHDDYCEGCEKCAQACPSKAITVGKEFNANRCLSYLTQAKIVPNDLKEMMKNHLYGCDICQLACPYNKPSNKNNEHAPIIDEFFDLKAIMSLNNTQFKSSIGKTAAGWRGKKMLQRNAIIALGNNKSNESVHLLNEFYQDIRVDIRTEIVHSLGRIGSAEAKQVLKERYKLEKNEEVRYLITKYLL